MVHVVGKPINVYAFTEAIYSMNTSPPGLLPGLSSWDTRCWVVVVEKGRLEQASGRRRANQRCDILMREAEV